MTRALQISATEVAKATPETPKPNTFLGKLVSDAEEGIKNETWNQKLQPGPSHLSFLFCSIFYYRFFRGKRQLRWLERKHISQNYTEISEDQATSEMDPAAHSACCRLVLPSLVFPHGRGPGETSWLTTTSLRLINSSGEVEPWVP